MPAAGNVNEAESRIVSDRKGYGTVFFILFVIAALLLLTNIPLLYGYLNQGARLKFMGIVAGLRDTNIHFMMMMQGDGSSPILENYFRPGEPNAIYHGFFWFFLGKLACWFGISNLAAYHTTRVLATIVFVPTIYLLLSHFLESTAERLSAAVVICFGAGAGWVMMMWYHLHGNLSFLPSDIGNPEASSFFTLMTFPHLSVALILISLCMMNIWSAVEHQKIMPAVFAGACGLLLGFVHTFNIVVLGFALVIFLLISILTRQRKSPVKAIVVFGSMSVWPLAYYAYIMLTRPGILPADVIRSPTPLAYLIGFAPLVLAAAIRIGFLWRARTVEQSDLFLLSWVVASFVLLYSYPIILQEARAVLGLQLPLAVLAVRAIFRDILPALGLDWNRQNHRKQRALALIIVTLFIVLTLPSTFYNVVDRTGRLKKYPELFSLTHDEYEALTHLSDVEGKGVVLSGERVGIYVPPIAHKRAWWSGQYSHPSYGRHMAEATAFFNKSTTDEDRYDMLRSHDIQFIFYGERERLLGEFRPSDADYLNIVFRTETVEVYEADLVKGTKEGSFSGSQEAGFS